MLKTISIWAYEITQKSNPNKCTLKEGTLYGMSYKLWVVKSCLCHKYFLVAVASLHVEVSKNRIIDCCPFYYTVPKKMPPNVENISCENGVLFIANLKSLFHSDMFIICILKEKKFEENWMNQHQTMTSWCSIFNVYL